MLLRDRTIKNETVNNKKKVVSVTNICLMCSAPYLILKNDHLPHATFSNVRFILPWFILHFCNPFRAEIEFVRLHWNVSVSTELRGFVCSFVFEFGWMKRWTSFSVRQSVLLEKQEMVATLVSAMRRHRSTRRRNRSVRKRMTAGQLQERWSMLGIIRSFLNSSGFCSNAALNATASTCIGKKKGRLDPWVWCLDSFLTGVLDQLLE